MVQWNYPVWLPIVRPSRTQILVAKSCRLAGVRELNEMASMAVVESDILPCNPKAGGC